MDGFGSAWAAWRVLKNRAVYRPSPPNPTTWPWSEDFRNRKIFLIDVSFSGDSIKRLQAAGNQVIVIDHHQTTADTMALADDHSFDLKHSAATLTWRYFQPKKPVPKLLHYIEDMDLWLFRLPQSRAISAFLELQKQDFSGWNRLAAAFEKTSGRKNIIIQGKILLAAREKLIGFLAANAEKVIFEGYETLAANSPFWPSEIGEAIYRHHPPLGIVWFKKKDHYKVSLRSDGGADVAALAEKYGGGGHKKAAGFRWPANKSLPWKQII